jgi:hypothetical protein
MKRIITSACLILTLVFCLPSFSQAQKRNAPRSQSSKQKTANHPPKINSFQSSAGTISIPCPYWDEALNARLCHLPSSHEVALTTEAADPDGDKLQYQYVVTGGQIIGKGSSVDWDLYQLEPGSYTVTVGVSDQHGGIASASISIAIVLCLCDFFCPTLIMTCPSEVDEGQQVTFSVSISGADLKMNLTYKWTVSAGTIIKDQGTPTIEVDTKGLGGNVATATVEVGGLPLGCDKERSCKVVINKKSEKQRQ